MYNDDLYRYVYQELCVATKTTPKASKDTWPALRPIGDLQCQTVLAVLWSLKLVVPNQIDFRPLLERFPEAVLSQSFSSSNSVQLQLSKFMVAFVPEVCNGVHIHITRKLK